MLSWSLCSLLGFQFPTFPGFHEECDYFGEQMDAVGRIFWNTLWKEVAWKHFCVLFVMVEWSRNDEMLIASSLYFLTFQQCFCIFFILSSLKGWKRRVCYRKTAFQSTVDELEIMDQCGHHFTPTCTSCWWKLYTFWGQTKYFVDFGNENRGSKL